MIDVASLTKRLAILLLDWDEDFAPPTLESLQTMAAFFALDPDQDMPNLGSDMDGNFSASWARGGRRLTIYFEPEGRIKLAASLKTGTSPADVHIGQGPIAEVISALPPFAAEIYNANRHRGR